MRKTKYLIIGILLLVSIPLILVNCQKETFDEAPQTGTTIKKISLFILINDTIDKYVLAVTLIYLEFS